MKIIRSINIEHTYWEELREIAEKENRSISNMIERLIDLYELQEGK